MDIFAKRSFSFANIPDLSGKVAIITGSNTGVSSHIVENQYFTHCCNNEIDR
jgi:hypothetical protein